MNVLILGGSRFFGKEVVKCFADAGHAVTLFTRGNESLTDLPHTHHIQGDREKTEDLKKAADFQKWDVVIDNIAYTGEHVRSALSTFSKTSHYILCSTISVYRYVPQPYCMPLKEDQVAHDFHPPTEDLQDVHWNYARGKLEAERECLRNRRVPWTILRPPVIYGPEDYTQRGFWYLARFLSGGPLLLADGGNQSFRLIYSKDAAKAFLQVAENRKKVLRKAYFIAQSEVITLKDFLDESAKALGIIPEFVSIPSEFLGEMAGPYASMVNLIPDISAARKDFGFAPTPWTEFARPSAEWFRDHWRGASDLLTSRPQEMQLAARWRHLLNEIRPG